MMMHRVYAASDGILSWLRENSVILTFLAGQGIVAILWGADINSRVRTIELRGSPAIETLRSRVDKNEFWITTHERTAAALQNSQRLTVVEREIAIIHEHDAAMLDIVKQNSVTLKTIAEGLTRHMLDTNRANGTEGKKP